MVSDHSNTSYKRNYLAKQSRLEGSADAQDSQIW